NKQLDSPEHVGEIVNEAIQTAYTEKGVSVLTIPSDVLEAKIGDKPNETYTFESHKSELDDSEIQEAATLINKSTKPVVLTGVGDKNAKDELLQFIEHAKLPSVITLPAKGIVPDTHDSYLGNLGKIGTKPAFEAVQDADLLIMIGTNYPYVNY